MDYYRLLDYWTSLVRDFKDSERQYNVSAYTAETLVQTVTDFVRFTRFRQYNLFTQQRGEEFERLLAKLEKAGFAEASVQRFVGNEELWTTTLQMGEQ